MRSLALPPAWYTLLLFRSLAERHDLHNIWIQGRAAHLHGLVLLPACSTLYCFSVVFAAAMAGLVLGPRLLALRRLCATLLCCWRVVLYYFLVVLLNAVAFLGHYSEVVLRVRVTLSCC